MRIFLKRNRAWIILVLSLIFGFITFMIYLYNKPEPLLGDSDQCKEIINARRGAVEKRFKNDVTLKSIKRYDFVIEKIKEIIHDENQKESAIAKWINKIFYDCHCTSDNEYFINYIFDDLTEKKILDAYIFWRQRDIKKLWEELKILNPEAYTVLRGYNEDITKDYRDTLISKIPFMCDSLKFTTCQEKYVRNSLIQPYYTYLYNKLHYQTLDFIVSEQKRHNKDIHNLIITFIGFLASFLGLIYSFLSWRKNKK